MGHNLEFVCAERKNTKCLFIAMVDVSCIKRIVVYFSISFWIQLAQQALLRTSNVWSGLFLCDKLSSFIFARSRATFYCTVVKRVHVFFKINVFLIKFFSFTFPYVARKSIEMCSVRHRPPMISTSWYLHSDGRSPIAWHGWIRARITSAYCHRRRTHGSFTAFGRISSANSVHSSAIVQPYSMWTHCNR